MTWNRDTLRTELHNLLSRHAQAGSQIQPESRLVADLGIDSLGQMEVVADVEDAFKLMIPDSALREIETVADIQNAIETRLQSEGRILE